MIKVQDVLLNIPHLETFCSVDKLHGLVKELRSNPRFEVNVAGTSANGIPIHHIRFGGGRVKAMFVGFPHCMEPIGSLTVFSLMSLLQRSHPALLEANVEWHIVPCIDPDGAMLNEGWTQAPFTLENYLRNYYVQPPHDQVDMSFPLAHKKLTWNQPSREAQVLQGIIDRVRPDFYYSLHNSRVGSGWFYLLNRDVGQTCYKQLHDLLQHHHISSHTTALHLSESVKFGEGIYKRSSLKEYYDYLERHTSQRPEEALKGVGATASEYVVEVNSGAQVLTTELDYVKHPSQGSTKDSGQSLRQLKLRLDADNKFLVAVILEEWHKVRDELDHKSPYYRKIVQEVVTQKDRLLEGLPVAWAFERTQELLLSPKYAGTMTEHARFFAWLWGRFNPLCNAYTFVHLLKASKQTPAVRQALERLEGIFEEALAELARAIDLDAFEVIDCDTLAKVQLGSGLIVLNSILTKQSSLVSDDNVVGTS